jgi:protease-4
MSDNTQPPAAPEPKRNHWERELLERLAFASLTEQRRARRWGIFFKLFFVLYLLLLLIMVQGDHFVGRPLATRFTAVIDMDGEIAADTPASADNIIAGLRAAFEDKGTAGIVLRANSPGGSPVQSAYINDEIRRLRGKYPKVPVYAVIGDICASGCYYAVVAADRIYADRASVVGSIGVLMNGFGFVDTMKKLGIERRLLTAGEHKGFLDPFSPLKPEDRKHAQKLLNDIHRQFIARVREGRGDALKETRDMYSGLFWTGEQAVAMGLVDEIGSAGYVAREVIGAEEVADFTYREGLIDRFARRFGAAMGKTLSSEFFARSPVLK